MLSILPQTDEQMASAIHREAAATAAGSNMTLENHLKWRPGDRGPTFPPR